MPGYKVADEFALSVLQAQPEPGSVAATGRPAGAGAPGGNAMTTDWLNRTTLLWGVLVLAVLVLGGLALSLLRSPTKLKAELRRSARAVATLHLWRGPSIALGPSVNLTKSRLFANCGSSPVQTRISAKSQ
jgi:hypothetical protein